MTNKTIFMKVLILVAIAALPYFSDKTFALADDDCDVITGNIPNLTKQVFSGETLILSGMYPVDALTRAIKNLTAYCCQNIIKQKPGPKPDPRCKDNSLPEGNYPESPYLFDHLIDVGLRRLDVINNYDKAPIVIADPTGIKRREFIAGAATNPDVTVPTTIVGKHKTYRTIKPGWIFKKTHLKIENMDPDEQGKFKNFVDQYNTTPETPLVSLADKYNNLCRIARNIYEKIPGTKIKIGDDKLGDKSIRYFNCKGKEVRGNYFTKCQDIVACRINQENLYVKAILIDKATKMLQDNRKKTNEQFVQDKLAGLQNTITTIKNLLQTLVRQAPYCKKCSK